jgi:hypothetical protein
MFGLFKKRPKPIPLEVGMKVPPELRRAWDEGRNVGAMISVCPCCDRIQAIFHQ